MDRRGARDEDYGGGNRRERPPDELTFQSHLIITRAD
jgi:hypothetical protein